jgi:hypothetical protein
LSKLRDSPSSTMLVGVPKLVALPVAQDWVVPASLLPRLVLHSEPHRTAVTVILDDLAVQYFPIAYPFR